ncbi:ABC transporter permease [Mycoplasmoides pneumoniae]|uniref:Uncharacterized protein MPN_333 n=1 Tax=Mycoplasma pneumoniae (strain ATCC 29342 / M129 / Subtype 1) TaxID=272634 RepID=Y333_MYCPN|nr:ABC transporter permease [Mycoplasmoides pneumoniae]P75445.1 RecName: Full=Uncharacterized protein MPN_333 [Mycoplasmoides pneumoniae M129]AAB96151.1 hypothetical protein MPN_333 [Mycoplasmoides pneumoniae M129]ARI12035.1 ABC transporter permease [Mycoplasmoides pneumoniae]ARI12384.1 ABC transporter permease [Mycoplasmoides pneumoniae]ARI13085.1 ABC transporter permease [Mycoplasmoides pneumoniae]ARI14148.1 ABC transporter permease [Mycoplasmoides pneumoniae]
MFVLLMLALVMLFIVQSSTNVIALWTNNVFQFSLILIPLVTLLAGSITADIFIEGYNNGIELFLFSKPISRDRILLIKLLVLLMYLSIVAVLSTAVVSLGYFTRNEIESYLDDLALSIFVGTILNGIIFSAVTIMLATRFSNIQSLIILLLFVSLFSFSSPIARLIFDTPAKTLSQQGYSVRQINGIAHSESPNVERKIYVSVKKRRLTGVDREEKELWKSDEQAALRGRNLYEEAQRTSSYINSFYTNIGYLFGSLYRLGALADENNFDASVATQNTKIRFGKLVDLDKSTDIIGYRTKDRFGRFFRFHLRFPTLNFKQSLSNSGVFFINKRGLVKATFSAGDDAFKRDPKIMQKVFDTFLESFSWFLDKKINRRIARIYAESDNKGSPFPKEGDDENTKGDDNSSEKTDTVSVSTKLKTTADQSESTQMSSESTATGISSDPQSQGKMNNKSEEQKKKEKELTWQIYRDIKFLNSIYFLQVNNERLWDNVAFLNKVNAEDQNGDKNQFAQAMASLNKQINMFYVLNEITNKEHNLPTKYGAYSDQLKKVINENFEKIENKKKEIEEKQNKEFQENKNGASNNQDTKQDAQKGDTNTQSTELKARQAQQVQKDQQNDSKGNTATNSDTGKSDNKTDTTEDEQNTYKPLTAREKKTKIKELTKDIFFSTAQNYLFLVQGGYNNKLFAGGLPELHQRFLSDVVVDFSEEKLVYEVQGEPIVSSVATIVITLFLTVVLLAIAFFFFKYRNVK